MFVAGNDKKEKVFPLTLKNENRRYAIQPFEIRRLHIL
jgi:hypothetical protein